MCAEGTADTDLCQLCGELGTPHHRLHFCPGHREARLASPVEFQHVASTADPSNLLWSRGLVADPSAQWPFRPVSEEANDILWRGLSCDDDGPVVLSGRGFMDGSSIGKTRLGGQAGWAAVE